MTNKQRGISKITLDKERTIKFDLNTLIDVEDKLGYSLSEMGEKVSIRTVRTLLTAGLRHEDAELTEQYVGSLITMDNLAEVQSALSVAMGASTKN